MCTHYNPIFSKVVQTTHGRPQRWRLGSFTTSAFHLAPGAKEEQCPHNCCLPGLETC